MAKWNPGKVIERHARRTQQAASRAITASTPKVPHRDGVAGAASNGQTGGSLARAVLAKSLVTVKRWGAVIEWSKLGQKFLWFVEGTSRQKPRPVPLVPDVAALTRDLQADAERHFEARARGGRGR